MHRKLLLKLKRIFLILFIFSLPFEYWDPFGISSFFSVTKMAGFGYAAVAFYRGRVSFDSSIFKYVQYLLIFWFWLVLLSMFNYTSINTKSAFNFTLLQNIIFYWLIASDLKRGNIQIKTIMLTFTISVLMMFLLMTRGIGIGEEYVEGVSRITFFGNNPNTVGILAGLAIVFVLYFILNAQKSYGKKGYLLLLTIPPFVNLLMESGSRGALITVVFSVVIMLVMNKAVTYKKVIQLVILVGASIFFMNQLSESQLMHKRIMQTIQEGNTAGRDVIWANAINVYLERPVTGYGTTGFELEMIKIYGTHKAAHNLFIHILVTTGIIGFGIFLRYLYFHVKMSLDTFRRGEVMKIVLFIFYFTSVIKLGGVINNKLMWLLLAIIISASFMGTQTRLRPAHPRLKYNFSTK